MANFLFNIALGKTAEYMARVNANDPTNSALIIVPVLSAGVETDAVLKDKDDLAAVFLGTTDEATAGGWNRKTLTDTGSITVTVDDTNDRVDVDCPDQTWTAVATGNNTAKLLFCYDNDTTAGTDANIVPLVSLDFSVTTDGSDVVAQLATAGFFRAS